MLSKNSGHHQFTEEASRASKNFAKGNELERQFSKIIHKKETAILVSSLLLRELACGQIDISSYKDHSINLYEVKSRPEGLNRLQYQRLTKSLELLINVFDASGRIRILNNLPKD